jgi:serine/threonine protein kinase
MLARTSRNSSQCSQRGLSSDSWKEDFSFINATCVGRGGSGSVFAIDKERVIKVFPGDEEGERDLERELAIYRKIQSGEEDQNIVKFYERWESGLVLQRHKSTLRQVLSSAMVVPPLFALQWSQEICRGLKRLHSKDILHGDLGCQNIMVNSDSHAVLCDFAGSGFRDGDTWNDAWISYEVRSQHPNYRGQQPTVETEIFAFGSVLFEIWTSQRPYALDSDAAVRKKFLAQDFPVHLIEHLRIREMVRKCWTGNYETVSAICGDLEVLGPTQ